MADIVENDIRKIHSEITQIVSQRFQLTTIAILVVAGVCGWATSLISGKGGGLDVSIVAAVTFLVILVLLMIFGYFMLLLGMMRIWTVYLQEKSWSQFELDWSEYRRTHNFQTYWGYTKAGTITFALLGPMVFGYFLTISWLSGALHYRPVIWLPIVSVCIYVFIVLGAGWARHKIIDEYAIQRNWHELLHKKPVVVDSPVSPVPQPRQNIES